MIAYMPVLVGKLDGGRQGERESFQARTGQDTGKERKQQADAYGNFQVNLFKRNSVYVSTIFVGAFAFGIGFDLAMTKFWEVGRIATRSRTGWAKC